MRVILFILSILLYATQNYTSKVQLASSGIVRVKRQLFEIDSTQALKPALTIEFNIWHNDSIAIEEVKMLRINTGAKGNQSTEQVVTHYVFMDARTHSFYYYKNFSDTATFFKSYAGVDSFRVDGGWNFYAPKELSYIGTPEALTDTTINGINFKRVRFKIQMGKNYYASIGYFQCDKKGTIFTLYRSYSEKLDCPLVRLDDFPLDKGAPTSTQITFLTDVLSQKERRVLAAWEENARNNPVK